MSADPTTHDIPAPVVRREATPALTGRYRLTRYRTWVAYGEL